MGRLDGKVAVITGAGSGIGAAAARLFAGEGATVVVADVLHERAEAVAGEIGGDPVAVDVTNRESVEGMIAHAVERHGRVDALCNNAGVFAMGALEETSDEEWARVLAVNLTGVFHGCRAVLPQMRAQGGGSIVNTGSMNSYVGFDRTAAYCASKGGVLMLTKALAIEVGRHRIRVNCVCPGAIATPMQVEVLEGVYGKPLDDLAELASIRADLSSGHPLGRVADPEEVAQAMLWLASDESSYVTGSGLLVDGGITAA